MALLQVSFYILLSESPSVDEMGVCADANFHRRMPKLLMGQPLSFGEGNNLQPRLDITLYCPCYSVMTMMNVLYMKHTEANRELFFTGVGNTLNHHSIVVALNSVAPPSTVSCPLT